MTRDSFFPNPDQRLLIEALLSTDDEAARRAVNAWLDRIVFDDLDLGTRRLLPLLHKRLGALDIRHPLEGRIKGIYRRAWYMDRQYRHLLDGLLRLFDKADIAVILLKGPALGLTIYPDPALRPFDDLDLMVPHEKVSAAQKLLGSLGFSSLSGYGDFGHDWHADGMHKEDHPEVDLHVSPFHEAFRPQHVAPLWRRSRCLADSEPMLRVLGVEDQLLHLLAHGLRPNLVSPVRWVVDTVHLLRAPDMHVDWQLFTQEAFRLDLVESSLRGLRYLADIDPDIVDDRAIERLDAASNPVSRAAFRYQRERGGMLGAWFMARNNAQGLDRFRLIIRRYTQAWGIASPIPFARYALSRFLRRLLA